MRTRSRWSVIATSTLLCSFLSAASLADDSVETAAPQCEKCPLKKVDAQTVSATRADKNSSKSSSRLPSTPVAPWLDAVLGEADSAVKACDHHVCEGDRCYIVSDSCDTCGSDEATKGLDPILETAAAPPSLSEEAAFQFCTTPKNVIPDESALSETVGLQIENARLSTQLESLREHFEARLELMTELSAAKAQVASLQSEVAALKAERAMADKLTQALVEQGHLGSRLAAAHEWISQRTAQDAAAMAQPVALAAPYVANEVQPWDQALAAIQEDLANLRRQLPLLRQTPVPFASSQLTDQAPSASVEATAPEGYRPILSDVVSTCSEGCCDHAAPEVAAQPSSNK